jgi:hypothetical protein
MNNSNIDRLSPDLVLSLNDLGGKLRNYTVNDAEIAQVFAAVSKLKPQQISSADTQIANAAGLFNWEEQPYGIKFKLFTKPTREQMLKRHEKLKYLYVFHRNGYMREAVLHMINEPLTSPFFVAALLWRLNDWVPEVRLAAEKCIERIFPMSKSVIIAEAVLPLISNWSNWSRWGSEKYILDACLEREGVVISVVDQIENSKIGPMSSVLKAALRKPVLDNFLIHIAANSIQPSVRAVAIQALIDGYVRWPVGFDWQWIDKPMGKRHRIKKFDKRPITVETVQNKTVALGISDRSPAVRSVTMSAIIRNRGAIEETLQIARHMINDSCRSVREKAQYLIDSSA